LKKDFGKCLLKEKLFTKIFWKIFAKNPLMQEFYENGFKKKKNPPCGGRSFLRTSFQKTPFLKRKPCRNCKRGISLIREYHSEVIFGLIFLQEEKDYKHGKVDKFLLTQLFPTACITLHHGLFTAQAYSGCIYGTHHRHGIHKHDSITIIIIYIQLCKVLWKQNAGTKEQKWRPGGSGPGRVAGDRL
jgi:hypothetical protein